jgi:hypothetical protein
MIVRRSRQDTHLGMYIAHLRRGKCTLFLNKASPFGHSVWGEKIAKISDISCCRVDIVAPGWSWPRLGVDLVRLVTENTQARRQLYVYCRGGRYSLEKKEAAKKPTVLVRKVHSP